jgi:ribosomal protein S18 acetylase RimI-like enzyme
VIETRRARPDEYDEAGRVTALAYREFVRPGETLWESYVEEIADVRSRAEIADVIVALEDGRIVGSATLELGDRIDADEDPPLEPDEAHIRMLGVSPDARGRSVDAGVLRGRARRRPGTDHAPHDATDAGRAGDVRSDGLHAARGPGLPGRVRPPVVRALDRER